MYNATTKICYQLLSECIDLLEEKLGIGRIVNNNTSTPNSRSDSISPSKKSKLGFLSDFFRSKRAKENDLSGGGNAYELTSADDYRRNSEVSIQFKSGQKQSDNINHRLVPLTDSDKETEEELNSIKQLQISREDNPALPPTGPLHRPLPASTAPNSSSPDHSRLVRSPPPMYRRDRSLSPGSGPLALRSEANRAQLEEDAAQILALHPSHGHVKSKLHTSQRSVSPRQLDPIISPRVSTNTTNLLI